MSALLRSTPARLALLLALSLPGFAACGGSGATTQSAGGGTPGGAGGAQDGAGGIGVGSGAAGSGGAGGACVTGVQQADLEPLDIYIMLDQSGSMVGQYDAKAYDSCTEAVQGGGLMPISRWSDVTAALNGFATDPQSAGINVGLGFFPPKGAQQPGQTKCEDNKCKVGAYAAPTVPIAALPGGAGAISTALDFMPCPCNGTPMSAALQGAVAYAKADAQKQPDHAVVVLLATDGEPNGDCSGSADDSKGYPSPVSVAKDALAGTPSIRTYVIGVGTALSSLDKIAAAGGTDKAFLVDGNQNTEQAFIDALNQIRGKALSCEMKIPAPPGGLMLDPDEVNVDYDLGNGKKVELARVADASGCAGAPSSWYYDDPKSPSQIILCDEACKSVQGAADKAKLEVAFGCATVVATPK